MLEGRRLEIAASLRTQHSVIWHTYEVRIYKVRYFEPDAGKTGKGIIHYWERADVFSKELASWCGQARAVDVEDIVYFG